MQQNRVQRQHRVPEVEAIAQKNATAPTVARRDLEVAATIRSMRTMAEGVRDRELGRALRRLGPLGPDEERVVRSLACNVVDRLLRSPTARLKALAAVGEGHRPAQLLRHLFGLPGSARQ